MIRNKTWAMLTQAEIDKEAAMSPKEKVAVDNLIQAVKALPKNFCLSVDEEGFFVQKRITKGYAQSVASVDCKTLSF